jgi:hypothetical protein
MLRLHDDEFVSYKQLAVMFDVCPSRARVCVIKARRIAWAFGSIEDAIAGPSDWSRCEPPILLEASYKACINTKLRDFGWLYW